MSDANDRIIVTAAEVYRGNVVIHFSNDTSVLYQAHFLHSVQHDDGNIALANDEDDGDPDEQKG